MNRLQSLLIASLLFGITLTSSSHGQGNWEDNATNPESWTTGNVGIGTSNPANLLDVRDGQSSFGSLIDYLRVDESGNLQFFGDARYFVTPNTHAFKAATSDIGLYFNATSNRLEFQDASGVRMFSADIAGPGAGNGYFENDLTVNSNLTVSGDYHVSGNTYAFKSQAGSIGMYFSQLNNRIELTDVNGARMFSTDIGGVTSGNGYFAADLEVTGELTAASFVGDGSGLTNLPAGLWVADDPDIYYVAGNVGVGIEQPGASLHVYQNELTEDVFHVEASGLVGAPHYLQIKSDGYTGLGTSQPDARFHIDANPGEDHFLIKDGPNDAVMLVDADGNIGIGHDNPTAVVHVAPNSDGYAMRIDQGTEGEGLLTYVNTTSADDAIFTATGLTQGMYVRGNGRVGFGTSSPEAVVHIDDNDSDGPALYLEGATSTEGDLTWRIGEILQMGTWDPDADRFLEVGRFNTSGDLELKNQSAETTLYFDHEGGTGGGGQIFLYNSDLNNTIELDADEDDNPAIRLYDENGIQTVKLDGSEIDGAGSGGGGANLWMDNSNGDNTIQIDADEDDNPAIRMFDQYGNQTIVIDGAQEVDQAGCIRMYNDSGELTVELDPEWGNDGEGRVITEVLQITGGSDLAEPFDINGETPVEPGMVVSIDPERPGELTVATKAYDYTVAGIVSGAGGIHPGMLMGQKNSEADGEHPVALSGRVYCMVDASTHPIRPGDLLTTSNLPGHAMKVENHDQAQGAIIGKAMTALEDGQGLVLVLVSLQ